MSKLFFQTLREVPADAEVASHQLMLRAGLVRQVAAGIFDFLPLGLRVKQKVEQILREEMDAIHGQEISMPMVQPAELWQRSGRWDAIGADMARLQDRSGRDLCLGMTHEEVVSDLVARTVNSYRQLPFMLYQIQPKFRDEPRPRAGLIRVREFTMKDGYSFHANLADLDQYYPRVYQAYFNIFRRCGLDVLAVESDTGMMGGTMAHEFMAVTPIGEDTLLICSQCDYRANRQIATLRKPQAPQVAAAPLELVHTPQITTIDALADYLQIPTSATAKALFLVADLAEPDEKRREQLVFALVRGDMELNETKLTNAIRARTLRPARTEEILAIGAEPGFGSPIGIDRSQVLLVVDDLVAHSPNLVAGANRVDFHYRHTNYGRDYGPADLVTDLVAAAAGHGCPRCGSALQTVRGVEVGNIFKLGTKYSAALGAIYLDAEGHAHPMQMGCYGIGSGRLIASVIEHHHDEYGICWPISIAPYPLSLVSLFTDRTPEVVEAADKLYTTLQAVGIQPLYDDRAERAGVKFNDADLLGMPLRLTVGARGLKHGVLELKVRRTGSTTEVALDQVQHAVETAMAAEWEVLQALVRPELLVTV